MAMANSIEGCFPFLDHRVVELAASMPANSRLNGLIEKFILKQIARDQVSNDLIDRPKSPIVPRSAMHLSALHYQIMFLNC